jgi:hypothetical protein
MITGLHTLHDGWNEIRKCIKYNEKRKKFPALNSGISNTAVEELVAISYGTLQSGD